MTQRLAIVALLAAGACSLEPAVAPLALSPPPPPSLQQLATAAGLGGAILLAEPCAGGLVGTRIDATATFGAVHAFEAALERSPEPRHLAAATLAREADDRLRISLQSCPGRGASASWLARVAEAAPERLRIDGLQWTPEGATIEGVADARAVIEAFAAALRADREIASVELPAIGGDGPASIRQAFVLVATHR